MKVIETIIKDVIISIYPALVSGTIFAVLIMIAVSYGREKGFKNIAKDMVLEFKTSKNFRYEFYLAFYIFAVLCKTLLSRKYYISPLANVFGNWGLYTKEGTINVEPFENFIFFIPLTIFIFKTGSKKVLPKGNVIEVILKSVFISFSFSAAIEILQVFFKLGTLQLSDLFFNTAGGLFGGLIYYVFIKVRGKSKVRKVQKMNRSKKKIK